MGKHIAVFSKQCLIEMNYVNHINKNHDTRFKISLSNLHILSVTDQDTYNQRHTVAPKSWFGKHSP